MGAGFSPALNPKGWGEGERGLQNLEGELWRAGCLERTVIYQGRQPAWDGLIRNQRNTYSGLILLSPSYFLLGSPMAKLKQKPEDIGSYECCPSDENPWSPGQSGGGWKTDLERPTECMWQTWLYWSPAGTSNSTFQNQPYNLSSVSLTFLLGSLVTLVRVPLSFSVILTLPFLPCACTHTHAHTCAPVFLFHWTQEISHK